MSATRPTVLLVDPGDGVEELLASAPVTVHIAPSLDRADLTTVVPTVVVIGPDNRHLGLESLGVPVVAIVGSADDVDPALRRGAHDVIVEPVSQSELVARLRAADRLWRARREAIELTRTDLLTHLSNRRHLEEQLERLSSMARRLRTAFSLLVVDVDRIRRINEAHGRSAGDAVIAEVAVRVGAELRSEDLAGRWGGEEFLILAPHTPLDGAWRLADRIRAGVCDRPIAVITGEEGLERKDEVLVTVSIGCAEGYGDDIEDHIRRATAALDEAKAAGRNRAIADTSALAP